ncbi:MAG: UDP-N-acetylmuramoyl-tripeptide--D-alanyl-D-alanine ligase, partial [Pseudomonadota bacterium]
MSEPLWTAAEIADATDGEATEGFDVTGLSIDTRSLVPGDLFVALTDARDGHDFVANAFEAGASGALVSRPVEGGPYILVNDVLEALKAMGRAARDRAQGCYRVAVTGSVGKTSVKEMIAEIFREAGRAHWSVKSFNNHWGVPLSLARMPRDTQFAVFEIGMSTPGEIAPRSVMVAPHTALITKIAAAHLEGVGSIDGVAKEKADIFAGLLPGGHIVLPQDSDYLERLRDMAQERKIVVYGKSVFKPVKIGVGRK